MKQKKSKIIFYILALAVISGLAYVSTHKIPLKTERIEQPIANDFLSK